ncbi:MAG TPA: sugar transferase [Alloprevotella sp.]|nr:sugar transferase [Alloprevotella sp.]
MYLIVKRLLGILFSLIALPFVLLLVLVVGLAIKLEDGGPVFYMAPRTGRYGKEFRMFKFRSMKVNAPDIRMEDGSTYNAEDDPRVTKVGRFIRRTSIDELPQILNILVGDMAWIGPRPDSVSYLDQYTEEERQILNVRPGITGWNQAVNRNSVGTKEKLRNDIYYVRHMSLGLDVKIVWLTIKTVFSSKDVYRA